MLQWLLPALTAADEQCESAPKPPPAARSIRRELQLSPQLCVCVLSYKRLDLLNATGAARTYLLPQATLKCLPTLERENPRQPTWTPMRLFLRRHLVEHAHRRWGDEAGLEAERRRRAAAKVKRDDAKAKDFFS